jgi:HEPN superfamily RES-like protein/RES domain-containing protein
VGTAKDRIMEVESRGCHSLGNKYVCSRCLGDYALRRLIRRYAEKPTCDYCGRSAKSRIAAPVDKILDAIVDGVTEEFEDVETSYLPYESAEGGWQGKTYDTLEVLDASEVDFRNDKLRDEITQAITTTLWCESNPFRLSQTESLQFSWDKFCKTTKHDNRYFISDDSATETDGFVAEEILSAPQMLETIGTLARKFRLIKRIPAGRSFVRARTHPSQESLISPEQLGPPPPEMALHANRVSPPGISLFYGAVEEDTAILEVLGTKGTPDDAVTFATWTTTEEVYILDLSAVPCVPSVFDSERRHLIPRLALLGALAADFSAPIERDGHEHIDFVPTQIVTDYFRRVFRTRRGKPLSGIMYRSCKRRDGKCIAFFAGQKDLFDRRQPILQLVPESTRKLSNQEVASLESKEHRRRLFDHF